MGRGVMTKHPLPRSTNSPSVTGSEVRILVSSFEPHFKHRGSEVVQIKVIWPSVSGL